MVTKLISIGKYLSIAIICLGIIHEVATFTPLIQDGLECLSKDNFNALIYNSLMCGALLILSGLLIFILLKKLDEHRFLSFPVLVCSIFVLIDGIAAVISMYDNPFAWMVFALGVCITIVAVKIHFTKVVIA